MFISMCNLFDQDKISYELHITSLIDKLFDYLNKLLISGCINLIKQLYE